MDKRIKIALLYGGRSGEHEISLMSAYSVLNALDANKYQIYPIGLSKEGRFFLNDPQDLLQYDVPHLKVTSTHSKALDSLIRNNEFIIPVDVVLPIVHGPLYEDGALQGLLELANCAYVGANVLTSAIGMDKDIAKRLAREIGIDTAGSLLVTHQDSKQQKRQLFHQAIEQYHWPLFVKPASLGSSVATYKVHSLNELEHSVNQALHYDQQVLIEQYIEGQEIELGLLENLNTPYHPIVSEPGEIVVNHEDGFYSYKAKYLETNTTELLIPAALDDALSNKARMIAIKLFKSFKCSGMARIDLFVTQDKKILFNEINTIPGFTEYSMYPKLMQTCGITYSDLLDKLIELALACHQRKRSLITNYQ